MGLFHPCEFKDYSSVSSKETTRPVKKEKSEEKALIGAPVQIPAEKRSCSTFFLALFASKKSTDGHDYAR